MAAEVEVQLAANHVYRPDLSGWRRERMPAAERRVFPVKVRPDWICEVLSPSGQSYDTLTKRHIYEQFGVPHYWLLDPARKTLHVLRLEGEHFVSVLEAGPGERVRAEPFELIELEVSALFMEDESAG